MVASHYTHFDGFMLWRLCRCILLITVLSLAIGGTGRADVLRREPEADNPEYLLDLQTNDFSRLWREVWDAGDNRFRLRLGSNNVSQWFLEEELKVSVDLSRRLRFRYNHGRLHRFTTERVSYDRLEFEGRFYGSNYLSIFAKPTSAKAKNAIGFMLQHRRAVNEYAIFFVEFPHFQRNFSERHRDNPSDTLLSVFSKKPVRFGVDVREPLSEHLWVHFTGELVPKFEMADERTATGAVLPREKGETKGLSGWVEYIFARGPSRGAEPLGIGRARTAGDGSAVSGQALKDDMTWPLRQETAVGIEYGYRKSKKRKVYPPGAAPNVLPTTGWQASPSASTGGLGPSPLASAGRVWSDIASGHPAVPCGASTNGGPGSGFSRTPSRDIDTEFYTPTVEDTVDAWREIRSYVRPYAWIVLDPRLTLRLSVRIEERNVEWLRSAGGVIEIRNFYVVPAVGLRAALGRSRRSVVEGGLVSEFRRREDGRLAGAPPVAEPTRRFDDHRVYVAFEYAFRPDRMIRITESLDLDSEDWGQFGIHDHGFFQVIMGF
jgi:hypothetical protein